MVRARSRTNGTVSAANLSFDGIDGGEGAGGGAGLGDAGVADGEDAATLPSLDVCFGPAVSSILVKYRKPVTAMATRQTTATTAGHIQFGAAEALVTGFLNCGVA